MNLTRADLRSQVGLRLGLVVGIIIVLLLSATLFVLDHQSRLLIERTGQSRVVEEGLLVEHHLTAAHDELLVAARFLARLADAAGLSADQGALLDTLAAGGTLERQAELDMVMILLPGNVPLLSRGERPDALESSEVLARAMGGESQVAMMSLADGTPILIATESFRGRSGPGAVVVGRQIDESFLAALAAERRDLQLALVTEGSIVATLNAATTDFDPSAVALARSGDASRTIVTGTRLTPRSARLVPLAESDGRSIAVLVQNDLSSLATFYSQLISSTALLFGVLGAVSLGVLALLINRTIVRPLSELEQVAQRVAAGDFSPRAAIAGRDEISQLARAFNQMAGSIEMRTAQLERMNQTLEEQVSARTEIIERSAEISRRLSMLLDPDQVRLEVVERVQELFGFSYVQVFMMEPRTSSLLIGRGTGEVGEKLRKARHRVPLGRGLVGRAAAENRVIFAPDVSRETDWQVNPLLRDTCAEIAIPISYRDEVLGVLDIQHDVPDKLRESDAPLLTIIANQVAVALRNARLFTEAQRAAERETTINAIGLRIQQAASVEQVLQIATQALGQALGPKRTAIVVGRDPTTTDRSERE